MTCVTATLLARVANRFCLRHSVLPGRVTKSLREPIRRTRDPGIGSFRTRRLAGIRMMELVALQLLRVSSIMLVLRLVNGTSGVVRGRTGLTVAAWYGWPIKLVQI